MQKVPFDSAAREFARFPVTGLPDDVGTLEVRFSKAGQWHPTEWVGTGASRIARILIAGPDADPGDAVVLAKGSYTPQLRLTDDPEIVVRSSPCTIVVS